MRSAKICLALFLLLALIQVAVGEENLYKILGVNKNATPKAIKKAFNQLSRKYHPDKNKEPEAAEYYAQIVNAYEILSDEQKREQYDRYGTVNPNQNMQQNQYYHP